MKILLRKIIFFWIIITSLSFGQTIEEYFRIAAENNPGLQAKYTDYQAALQKVPQVSTLPDPTFSFGYFISPVETRVGAQQAKFSLTQMFPWFGTLKAQGDAAALQAEAKLQAFIEARNRLYYRVAAAWYPLYELERFKELEQENITILESYKNIVAQKFGNGTGPMVDVLRVDIMLKEAQTRLNILDEKEIPLRTAFNNLLNRSADHPVIVADTLLLEPLPAESMKDSMLVNNPLLEELELKYQSAQAAERAAFRQGLPRFGIGLDYVLVDERSDMNITDNGKDVLMPMLSVSIPIFRGKYSAAKEEARLRQQIFRLQKEERHNTLLSDYEMIRFEIHRKQELISLYEQQIRESRQTLNLLFSAYGNSGKDFEEVLRMEQQLLQYKKMKATALSEYHVAVEKLNYLTAKRR